jgi:hypothetical protein
MISARARLGLQLALLIPDLHRQAKGCRMRLRNGMLAPEFPFRYI